MKPRLCVAVALLAGATACSGQDDRLRQHRQAFDSLGVSTRVVASAWLSGQVSGTYTRTALEQAFRLVEQERRALAANPQTLIDPRGARLSERAERLSRVIAAIMKDVSDRNAANARRDVAKVPIEAAETP